MGTWLEEFFYFWGQDLGKALFDFTFLEVTIHEVLKNFFQVLESFLQHINAGSFQLLFLRIALLLFDLFGTFRGKRYQRITIANNTSIIWWIFQFFEFFFLLSIKIDNIMKFHHVFFYQLIKIWVNFYLIFKQPLFPSIGVYFDQIVQIDICIFWKHQQMIEEMFSLIWERITKYERTFFINDVI